MGLALLLPASCSGMITPAEPADEAGAGDSGRGGRGGDGTGGRPPTEPGAPPVMRRLTRTEFNYVALDLLGDDSLPAKLFPAEETVAGFDNNAAALTLPPVMAQALVNLAPGMAAKAIARGGSSWAPCLAKGVDRPCARTFLTGLGLRAWRRPLDDDEVESLMALVDLGVTHQDLAHGIALAAEALFVSPAFLYRIEEGSKEPVPGKPGHVYPTPYEMAARLSFLLWRSVPDQELLDTAARGGLRGPEAVKEQAARMLTDAKADRMVLDLHTQWWELDKASLINKDPDIFKNWRDELGPLFRQETQAFVQHLSREGTIADWLAADFTFANQTLAAYYGLAGVTGNAFVHTPLPPEGPRRGFLTHGSFLATHAGFDQSSPTLRGAFIRERILCDELSPPPASVDNTPPAPSAANTTRQRYERISENPSCAACHLQIDPIGFGLESFDAAAGLRSQDNGFPIDTRGKVMNHDLGDFAGPVALSEGLGSSTAFQNCAVKQWFRFAMGKRESGGDDPALAQLQQNAEAANGQIQSLLLDLTQTDDFLYLQRP